MSGGDTQPKKRKDKKRKKDDEDTVKETTVHAPKQAPSAGAAQAAKEPGDIQMHIHSDHGTGGHWCAKVVFFILLAGLGALVGLIIMENKGLSNDDTPLSESRYSEFFNGWVDETRQDDHHHHEEILDAINSIHDHDDHDDDGDDDAAAHAVDDHDDDEHGDGDGDDKDDGAPYPEEDDNDDDEAQDEDDEDEGPAQKLDDDEVEEIYAQQEAGQQEAIAEAKQDDDDDGVDDGDDDAEDEDDDNDGADTKSVVDNDDNDDDDNDDDVVDAKQNKVEAEEDNEDDDNDDDKNDAEQDDDDDDKTRTTADNKDEGVEVDDDEDDDDDNDNDEKNSEENDDDEDNEDDKPNTAEVDNSFDDQNDDDDEEDDEDKIVTDNRQVNEQDNAVDNDDDDDDDDDGDDEDEAETAKGSDVPTSAVDDNTPFEEESPETPTKTPSVAEVPVTGDVLKEQMDELVRNFNKLAESLEVDKIEEETQLEPGQTLGKDDDDDFDGDDDEIEAIKVGSQQSAGDDDNDDDDDDDVDDDGKADFGVFVDNDGGEEEYLAKLRREQELRVAAEEARKAATEPEEETSQPPAPVSTSDAKGRTQNAESSVQTSVPSSQQQAQPAESQRPAAQARSVLEDFVYAGPTPQQHSSDGNEVIEDNVIPFEDEDEGERYSGDEYEYELEELEEEAEEELEEINPEEDEESEQKLIAKEQEIGAFVPITFEDFSSMYRASPEVGEMREQQQQRQQLESEPQSAISLKKLQKDSLLARKKPPKGAVNKLIYGLHKDPIVIPDQEEEGLQPATASATAEARENVSAKGENARSVLTALLSEIPSPPPPLPPTELDHQFDKFASPILPSSSPRTVAPGRQDVMFVQQQPTVAAMQRQEKHVEFRLPEPEEPEMLEEIEPFGDTAPTQLDNGSKENLFVPDASEEELDPEEYGAEYDDEYGVEYEDEEHLYDQDDIDSVLLNQYGSDEEEEPLTDDNIPPGGGEDEESDVDDSDLMRRLEEKYGKLPSPAASSSAAQSATGTSPAEPEDAEEDEATAAGWTKIPTRAEEADRSYQEELRRAQQQLDEGKAQDALKAFDGVLSRRKPNSIPALVGRARALDALAEQRRSNTLLSEAIAAYRKLIVAQELSLDDATLRSIGARCIDRMRFQGQHANAVEVHQTLIRRFNDEPHFRNQLAVTYLYMNRLAEAKAVLHETLLRWIEDGFALVHYGFVLKTHDQNMELAAQYLREGIDTGHEGTQDGRFYFHLGDALQRLGRTAEAHDIYRRGVQRKLFLSLYQRSLYNVDGLKSRPFWTEQQTTYGGELERIRAQWTLIRDEGLKLLNSAGVFVNETENLRDRGDWKQLELFSRGARVERNCARAPLTCRLVEQHFTAARTCKRGQVKFSVMHPGTHVWPHCGPTNCRIRAHLGLNVPSGTYIRVAEETRSWENGKWLIFDDSFEHEVWHNGTSTRLVLIVDFWHPELTESQRRTLSPI